MGAASPEEQAVRQALNIAERSASCCSIAAHALEPGIYDRKIPTPKNIRQGPEHAYQEPGEDNCKETLLYCYAS